MAFHYEMRFAGIGGQGNMLAANVVAETAVRFEKRFATETPMYTSQVRGGPTKADVIVSDQPIEFADATHLDFMLALEANTWAMFKRDLKRRALVLVDNNLVQPSSKDNEEWDVYGFPIVWTAQAKIGNVRTANILAVGMIVGLTGVVAVENVRRVLTERLRPALLDMNLRALDMGLEVALELRREKNREQAAATSLLEGHLAAVDGISSLPNGKPTLPGAELPGTTAPHSPGPDRGGTPPP